MNEVVYLRRIVFLINLDFTEKTIRFFNQITKTSLSHNKFQQSGIFDRLSGLSDRSLSSVILKISLSTP